VANPFPGLVRVEKPNESILHGFAIFRLENTNGDRGIGLAEASWRQNGCHRDDEDQTREPCSVAPPAPEALA
jgi:hypothetical protein